MGKTKKLVIVGAGEFGEIAYEYFTFDSEYEVVAFAVEKAFKSFDTLFGLPVIEFETMKDIYDPADYEAFVAITYVQLNRVRKRMFELCKKMGYTCASYISSRAFVWHNVEVGENTFIFEDNTIQYHVKIGNDVVLWSGNHVGHRTVIEDHCWFTSHCVVSGFCKIGAASFLGVNATLGDNVQLGKDTIFGAAAVTVKSLPEEGCVYVGNPARKLNKSSYQQFEVK
jgi:sugar O-acyltransferase (sialic acid O-acetyltransferase NeuD family)